MTRINIIGASGTGKTTLAAALAERLGWPSFDSDHYFHLPSDPPFQYQRAPDERLQMLAADTAPYRDWILSGSQIGWGEHAAIGFELIVFLRLDPAERLTRLRWRERVRFGARLEPGGDMYQDHLDFMAWTAHYDDGTAALNNLCIHEAWLAEQQALILRLSEPLPTEAQIERILAALASLESGI